MSNSCICASTQTLRKGNSNKLVPAVDVGAGAPSARQSHPVRCNQNRNRHGGGALQQTPPTPANDESNNCTLLVPYLVMGQSTMMANAMSSTAQLYSEGKTNISAAIMQSALLRVGPYPPVSQIIGARPPRLTGCNAYNASSFVNVLATTAQSPTTIDR